MRLALAVAAGSAIGGVARFYIGALVQQRGDAILPTGTLFVNITGSLLLGLLMSYMMEPGSVSNETRALLTTGLCGGYTTFSAFSNETATMIRDGEYRRAALYITASVVLSVLAMLLGLYAGARMNAASRGG